MTPRISVITVTYHATPLEYLYLWSLAASGLKHSEVIIVDNTGKDPILLKIKEKYPFVRIIHNTENEGFGRACNRGFAEARGDIALFLNPDTIVPEDFEDQILEFFNTHPRCGAMGAMMIDGQGHFLPESKRNFPTPAASFLRFSGLDKFFHSKEERWSYYVQQSSPNVPFKVPVLAGAFMAVTRKAMQVTGGFDPRFFMFAEDIDLSVRIARARLEVWYNPRIRIIHFKGQTARQSKNYPSLFYNSMSLFYQKYYKNHHSHLQCFFIKSGISLLKKFAQWRMFFRNSTSGINSTQPSFTPESSPRAIKAIQPKTISGTYSKNKKPGLLLSTLELFPSKLITLIAERSTGKPKIFLYHDETGNLFELSDKNHFVQILL